MGTGSGQAVLRRAAREPGTMFLGVDADARAMAEASRRAAGKPARGGLANAVFLAAAAEEMPSLLVGRADELTIVLPWGSLLGAVLRPGSEVFERLLRVLKPQGGLELLASTSERDAAALGVLLDERGAADLAAAYRKAELAVEFREATAADVLRLSSAWGRRLGIPDRRRAWLFRLRKEEASRASS
jgi:16S rRNA (adenine(1408)-N(1))-methyltransferase